MAAWGLEITYYNASFHGFRTDNLSTLPSLPPYSNFESLEVPRDISIQVINNDPINLDKIPH